MEKMTVGILSMQRAINYGSFLQAYALKNILLKAGAGNVRFIDIKPGRQLEGMENHGFRYRLRRLYAMCRVILRGDMMAKRKTLRFMSQVSRKIRESWPELGIDDDKSIPSLVVIGSDEVFHCCQPTPWGYTPQLYGDIPEAEKVISYAGSFGHTTLEKLKKQGLDTEIGKTLSHMDSISVRDRNSYDIVKKLTGTGPEIHFDPVLIYGFKDEIAAMQPPVERNYILLYSYPDRINNKDEIKAIRDYARSKGKKLICIMSRYEWCSQAVVCKPLDVLRWYKYADEVITETFHGTIFAIITHKPFATIGRDSAMAKLTSMLKPFWLDDRIVGNDNTFGRIFERNIDYDSVERVLDAERARSVEYLGNAISGMIR